MPRKTKKRPRGPAYVVTAQRRNSVMLMVAAGDSENAVAAAMDISRDTLRRHFMKELEFGRAKKKLVYLQRLEKASFNGNITATIRLLNLMDKSEAAEWEKQAQSEPQPLAPKKLGKKEQAIVDARDAGTGSDWGTDLNPPPSSGNH